MGAISTWQRSLAPPARVGGADFVSGGWAIGGGGARGKQWGEKRAQLARRSTTAKPSRLSRTQASMHFCKSKYQGSQEPLPFALMRAVHLVSSAVSTLHDFSHSLSIEGLRAVGGVGDGEGSGARGTQQRKEQMTQHGKDGNAGGRLAGKVRTWCQRGRASLPQDACASQGEGRNM